MAVCSTGSSSSIDVGDQPVVFADVFNDDGVAETPTDGRLLILKPGATVAEIVDWTSLIKEPDGFVGRVEYTFPTPLDTPGVWRLWWEFTGGVNAAEPFSFSVRARTVPAP